MFSDTLESSVLSRRGNRYGQVFCTSKGWCRAYPMKKKGEAHEALSLLLSRVGAPPELLVDGSKEQTAGEFKKKAREAGIHIKQFERGSPWSNAAEGCMRELKRGAGRKMVQPF